MRALPAGLWLCFVALWGQLVGCASQPTYPLQQKNLAVYAKTSTLLDVPIVLQRDKVLSAVAVLESISIFWHKPLFQDRLSVSYPPENRDAGYSIAEITALAQRFGFSVLAMKADLSLLRMQLAEKHPLIIELKLYDVHYYVLASGYHAEGLWLMDPAKGMGFITYQEFESLWSESGKKVILLEPR